jgi:DNA-binding XRE family transcriptional regulator
MTVTTVQTKPAVTTVQTNLRLFREHREIVLKVAARLKSDPAFMAALTGLLDTPSLSRTGTGAADRFDALEKRVALLERHSGTGAAPEPPKGAGAKSRPARNGIEDYLIGVTGSDDYLIGDTAPALGGRVRAARIALGWNQATLAAKTGCKRGTIGNVELGRLRPGPALRAKLATALGMTDDEWRPLDGVWSLDEEKYGE